MSKEDLHRRQQDPQKEDDCILQQTDNTNAAEFTSRFLNDFENLGCLGKGGFGVVFKAKSKIDHCDYAIKKIALQNSEETRERVMREVKALAKLDHYNIVRYFNAWLECPPVGWQEEHDQQGINGQTSNSRFIESAIDVNGDGYSDYKSHSSVESELDENPMEMFLYIQMQLCERLNLEEWLRENYSRDYLCIFEIFEQIANAVKYIHLEGIIHRDLKPSNIFFAHDEVKIGDFGLATATAVTSDDEVRTLDDVSETNNSATCLHTAGVGTSFYIAPEQLDGRNYNEKVDIYSLGIIFYELLVPFSTQMERSKVLEHLSQSIFPPDFSLKYPAECELLKMMLDHNPRRRPTMWEVKDVLKTRTASGLFRNKRWFQRG